MDQFKIPPVSTLLGSTLRNYFKILGQGRIMPKYYFKIFLTTLVVIIATPFHFWEKIVFYRKLKKFRFEKPPLFILGHWRSGTTLLHNMLTKDPSAGYMTTYQGVFPNNLTSKWLFRTFMKINMPERRPSDGVKLDINYPQEDEFAFSNTQSNAYYNFFYFPENYQKYYERAVHFKGLNKKEIECWYKSYDKLVKKALLNSKGSRVIFKNPLNTARIDKLLHLYPDAKFLFIYRNPFTVFYSTRRFFQQLYPTLWLHSVDNEFIDKMIFEIYLKLMDDYYRFKNLIPKENLLEVCFEEFEKNPVTSVEKIYSNLLQEDFEQIKHYFSEYFQTQKSHKKNKYLVESEEIEQIKKQWKRYIDMYKYELPEDVIIKSKS